MAPRWQTFGWSCRRIFQILSSNWTNEIHICCENGAACEDKPTRKRTASTAERDGRKHRRKNAGVIGMPWEYRNCAKISLYSPRHIKSGEAQQQSSPRCYVSAGRNVCILISSLLTELAACHANQTFIDTGPTGRSTMADHLYHAELTLITRRPPAHGNSTSLIRSTSAIVSVCHATMAPAGADPATRFRKAKLPCWVHDGVEPYGNPTPSWSI